MGESFFSGNLHSRMPEKGLGTLNYIGYANPKVDALIEESFSTMDVNRQIETRREAIRLDRQRGHRPAAVEYGQRHGGAAGTGFHAATGFHDLSAQLSPEIITPAKARTAQPFKVETP